VVRIPHKNSILALAWCADVAAGIAGRRGLGSGGYGEICRGCCRHFLSAGVFRNRRRRGCGILPRKLRPLRPQSARHRSCAVDDTGLCNSACTGRHDHARRVAAHVVFDAATVVAFLDRYRRGVWIGATTYSGGCPCGFRARFCGGFGRELGEDRGRGDGCCGHKSGGGSFGGPWCVCDGFGPGFGYDIGMVPM
jgi:hypothetical protein